MDEMTPEGFKAWRTRMAARHGGRYSQVDAARDLGVGVLWIKRLEKGARSDVAGPAGGPRPVTVTRAIALACAALEAGLEAE